MSIYSNNDSTRASRKICSLPSHSSHSCQVEGQRLCGEVGFTGTGSRQGIGLQARQLGVKKGRLEPGYFSNKSVHLRDDRQFSEKGDGQPAFVGPFSVLGSWLSARLACASPSH